MKREKRSLRESHSRKTKISVLDSVTDGEIDELFDILAGNNKGDKTEQCNFITAESLIKVGW